MWQTYPTPFKDMHTLACIHALSKGGLSREREVSRLMTVTAYFSSPRGEMRLTTLPPRQIVVVVVVVVVECSLWHN